MNQIVQAQYLQDTLQLLMQMARDARIQKDLAIGTDNYTYSLGYLMAFYEVVTLLQSQAGAFNISLTDLGINDVSPDHDLL
ncbi:MAG: hypothetical protein U0175_16965 [Caldilineaceae bacterium]